MAQPDLVSTEKDAGSSTESSLDFLERFGLTLPESLSSSRLLYAPAAVTPLVRAPSQRLEQGPWAGLRHVP